MTENNEHLALWGGRFTSGPSPELARLSKSTQFDWRLADDDIAGSRAHARALGRAGLLTDDELQRMEDALDTLQRHVDDGSFAPIEDDEDEATALERGLIDIAGDELGGKLRAGRSRNDQIACLIRMWLRRHSRVIAGLLLDLVNALIEQSEKAGRTVMPGRTHMQHAQPVLLAHQLMAHAWPLIRDVQRLIDWDKRINASPYGSGALATDIAEWLVKNGVPFRHAHELSGACVKLAEGRGQELWDLTDNDFIETFAAFLPADKAPGVREVLSSHGSVDSRNGKGGTAYGRVREQIADAKAEVEELKLFPASTSDGSAYKAPGTF